MELQAIDSSYSTEINLSVLAGRASSDVKLAHKVAVMLQHEIISEGLPEGYSLGTAADIRARYNVGRWAFREAVGILELRGIARLKSGPGGGVIVTEPDFSDLVNLTLLYLYTNRSGPREISEVRRSVMTAVVKKLLDCQADSAGPGHLSADSLGNVDQAIDLPRFLAAQSGNNALELAVEFVESVREACVPPQASSAGEAEQARREEQGRAIWLSICRGSKEAALSKLDEFLTVDEHRMADAWTGLPELTLRRTGAGKLAYRLALEILKDVVEHPDRSGDFFGSENEIGIRFDATAEIVRQAVRLIEDLGVVAPRRGRSGGVVVRPPDVASIAALIPHLLSQKRVSVATCCEAARYLSDEIARLAAKRMKASGKPKSRAAGTGGATYRDAMAMNQQIQTYADNPLLSSIERGMGVYSYTIDPPVFAIKPPTERVIALSQRVLDAVEDGDVEAASEATRDRFQFMSLRFAAPKHFAA
ncbi:GntR domain protein [Novosphingobium sp. Rr 2-17]|uniref:FadR/GntR family transcriptional regulator n=1 Tax=Novosphingobium sp. Rr 2-17 TaxID=555793 RepID=UPI00026981F4|nr:FadR family transcriptional regulator [Novosphingobium sp. Rr 2-17]EIZ79437.1 GntR domain protein [Novosphingobium sp. Rr 2-17]